METRYLRTLKVVLETGSFSRAAQELCISQSAVSQRIKLLEDHYGCQLIDRSGPLLTATIPGEKVLEKTNMILLAVQDIENDVKNIGKKAQLSISFTPTFGFAYLPKVLEFFLRENSEEVNLKFISQQPDEALKGLATKVFDVTVIEHCDEISKEDFALFPLPADELVLISSPALGIAPDELRLEEYFKHRLITRREGCSSRCLLNNNLSKSHFSIDNFKGKVVYDDLHIIIQSILQGRGVAFISRSLVSTHIDGGDLREHIIPEFCNTRSRTLVCNRNRINESYLKGFIECVHYAFDLQSPFESSETVVDV